MVEALSDDKQQKTKKGILKRRTNKNKPENKRALGKEKITKKKMNKVG